MVTGDNIPLLIHTQATVSITVIGETNIQPLLYHKLLQPLNMSRASVQVDVQTVGLVVDDIGVCAQRIEHALGNVPAGTIGTIQTDLDSLERVDTQRDQVAHIAIAACYIVHSAADMLTTGKGQFRPVLIEHMEFAVDVIFHQQQRFFRHLLTIAVNQLNAVVVIRIVAGRNHNATVEIIYTSDVSYRRSGGDMEQISICSRGRHTCNQTVLEHIGAAASILADDDTSRIVVTISLTQSIIIPAEEATHFISMVCC
jgi:hypothetical protein